MLTPLAAWGSTNTTTLTLGASTSSTSSITTGASTTLIFTDDPHSGSMHLLAGEYPTIYLNCKIMGCWQAADFFARGGPASRRSTRAGRRRGPPPTIQAGGAAGNVHNIGTKRKEEQRDFPTKFLGTNSISSLPYSQRQGGGSKAAHTLWQRSHLLT